MPITVINAAEKDIKSAGITFKPGKNTLEDDALSPAKLAQVRAVDVFSVNVVKAPSSPSKATKDTKQ